jgi:hypothetical protein
MTSPKAYTCLPSEQTMTFYLHELLNTALACFLTDQPTNALRLQRRRYAALMQTRQSWISKLLHSEFILSILNCCNLCCCKFKSDQVLDLICPQHWQAKQHSFLIRNERSGTSVLLMLRNIFLDAGIAICHRSYISMGLGKFASSERNQSGGKRDQTIIG